MTAGHAGVWLSVPTAQEDSPKLHFNTITSISLGFSSGLQVVFCSPVIFMHLKPPSTASEQTHKHTDKTLKRIQAAYFIIFTLIVLF